MSNNVEMLVDHQNGKLRIRRVRQNYAFSITVSGGSGTVPKYNGEYEVTPKAHESVVLETAGQRMEQNVVIFEIPYWETSNPEGGETIYIGGTV